MNISLKPKHFSFQFFIFPLHSCSAALLLIIVDVLTCIFSRMRIVWIGKAFHSRTTVAKRLIIRTDTLKKNNNVTVGMKILYVFIRNHAINSN